MKDYILKVINIKQETSDVKTIRFSSTKEKINFKPGQFITIFLEGTKKPAASYSIASAPNEDYIEISVKNVGEFSNRLCNLEIGDEIRVRGPFGHYYFEGQFKNDIVLIAGGIGICPLKSMIGYAIKKNIKNNITLIYSCRTLEDIIHYDYLKNIRTKNIKVVFTLTREKKDWDGEAGRIDEKLIKKYVKDVKNSIYYVCGLIEMADSIKKILERLGVKEENIKIEAWG